MVFPFHGDFCQTPLFHFRLVAQLMSEGFLPIATTGLLLPKLHRERCVVQLPDCLHVPRSTKKKAKRFRMTANKDFDGVVAGCHQQHDHCWLIEPLVEAFRTILEAPNGVPTGGKTRVRLFSFEVWNEEDELVAGELGYTVGSIYTSLTGFSQQDSAGSVQLVTLGTLLVRQGFTLWDLGMDMDYKRELGAGLMTRANYVAEVRRVRETNCVLPPMATGINCKSVFQDGGSAGGAGGTAGHATNQMNDSDRPTTLSKNAAKKEAKKQKRDRAKAAKKAKTIVAEQEKGSAVEGSGEQKVVAPASAATRTANDDDDDDVGQTIVQRQNSATQVSC